MISKFFSIVAALLVSVILCAGPAMADKRFTGEWFTKENKSKILIEKCGKNLCGKIIWLKEPNKKDGTPKTDANNPKENLRSRKIVGLPLLSGFVKAKEDKVWEEGKIYNPEDGETYSCTLTLQDDGKLEVRGYVGLPIFGKSQIWTRPKS